MHRIANDGRAMRAVGCMPLLDSRDYLVQTHVMPARSILRAAAAVGADLAACPAAMRGGCRVGFGLGWRAWMRDGLPVALDDRVHVGIGAGARVTRTGHELRPCGAEQPQPDCGKH